MYFLLLDHKEELEKLQNKYKEERQERKKLKTKVEHMEEEIQEVKQEKESVEKVSLSINNRKKNVFLEFPLLFNLFSSSSFHSFAAAMNAIMGFVQQDRFTRFFIVTYHPRKLCRSVISKYLSQTDSSLKF